MRCVINFSKQLDSKQRTPIAFLSCCNIEQEFKLVLLSFILFICTKHAFDWHINTAHNVVKHCECKKLVRSFIEIIFLFVHSYRQHRRISFASPSSSGQRKKKCQKVNKENTQKTQIFSHSLPYYGRMECGMCFFFAFYMINNFQALEAVSNEELTFLSDETNGEQTFNT